MHPSAPLLPVLLLLLLISLTPNPSSASHLRTPSGRAIPISLIRRHVPTHPLHLLPSLLFEHDFSSHVIRSHHLHLHIPSLAPTLHPIRSVAGFTLNLNAHAHPVPPHPAFVRTGPKHSFTLIHLNGRTIIASAHAHGLNLRPLHPVQFPHVLINVHRPTSRLVATRRSAINTPRRSRVTGDLQVRRDAQLSLNVSLARQMTTTCLPTDDIRYVEIAFAFDKSFCALYDNLLPVAVAVIQGMVVAANVPYRAATCVSLALTHVDAFCASSATDPFGPPAALTDGSCGAATPDSDCRAIAIINQFTAAYQSAPFSEVSRDTTYLITGYEDNSDIAGLADLASVCGTTSGYGWVEESDPFILAHELGHTLSAEHVTEGIMKASINATDTTFSAASASTISSFVATNAQASCVTTAAPACDSTCPTGTGCTNGRCVLATAATPPGSGVLCSPIRNYFCVDTATLNNPDGAEAVNCPSTYNFVLRSAVDSTDLSIFCCFAPTASAPSTQTVLRSQTTEFEDATRGLVPIVDAGVTPAQNTLIAARLDADCSGVMVASMSPTTSPTPTTTTTPSPGASSSVSTTPSMTPSVTPSGTPSPSVTLSGTPSPPPSPFILSGPGAPSPGPSPFTLPGPGQPPPVSVSPGPTIFVLSGPTSPPNPNPSVFILPPANSQPVPSGVFILPGAGSTPPVASSAAPSVFVLPPAAAARRT